MRRIASPRYTSGLCSRAWTQPLCTQQHQTKFLFPSRFCTTQTSRSESFQHTPSATGNKLTYEEWEEQLRDVLKYVETVVTSNLRVGFTQPAQISEQPTEEGQKGMSELQRLLLGLPNENVFENETQTDSDLEEEEEGEENNPKPDEFLDLAAREPEDLPFPYRLLDWRWYQRTDEDERIRQILQWKPFSRRGAKLLAHEKAFKENPFAATSPIPRSAWELEQYRRMRLETFFSDQLGRLAELMDNPYSGRVIRPEDHRIRPAVMSFEETTAALITDLRIIDRKIRDAKLTKQDAERVTEEINRLEESTISDKERNRILKELSEDEEEGATSKPAPSTKRKRKHLCVFCKPAGERPMLEPMNLSLLLSFLTPVGDIVPRRFNGNCATHQRRLAKTIKQARTMGLLSCKRGGFTAISPFHEPDPYVLEIMNISSNVELAK